MEWKWNCPLILRNHILQSPSSSYSLFAGILAKAIVNYDNKKLSHTSSRKLNKIRSGNKDSSSFNPSLPPPIHVVTKIWYTHLGYDRTKIAIREILQELRHVTTRQVYIHLLLHWPRCDDSIPWMDCETEEENLPQNVKDAGPPPHLHKDTAWKDSWKALEEVYDEHASKRSEAMKTKSAVQEPIIASIGVSNFEIEDMKALRQLAVVQPHIYQGDVWKAFHDPNLLRQLKEMDTFFQAYGVMNRVMGGREEAPSAFGVLTNIAREITATLHEYGDYHTKRLVASEATILLAFCVQRGIGVIPRTSSATHRRENAPDVIADVIPNLTSTHISQLELAIPALMRGEELHASISFMNSMPGPIQIHWIHTETGEEILVKEVLQPGEVDVIKSHPGHRFVAYDTEREVRREVSVEVGYGERQHFAVEL